MIMLTNVEDMSAPPENAWIVAWEESAKAVLTMSSGSFVGLPVKIDYISPRKVKREKWTIKKLAYELLPDRLLSALSAAANTAHRALTAANTAQGTASAAQSTAKAAQSTAEAAQSTAEAAQSTAEAAKILPVQYNYFAGLYSKYNSLLGWYQAYPVLDYRKSGGYFCKSSWERQPIAKNDIPNSFFCQTAQTVDGRNSDFEMLLHSSIMTGNKWGVVGVAIADDGRLYTVKSNSIPMDDTQGIQFVFSPPVVGLLASSTLGSTKKFKITVDDTGTLSATEVTDTTT